MFKTYFNDIYKYFLYLRSKLYDAKKEEKKEKKSNLSLLKTQNQKDGSFLHK